MKYWIRIKRGDEGPYSADEIKERFGVNLPCDTLCAKVGTYEWSTLGQLLPEIGTGAPTSKKPEPSPKTNNTLSCIWWATVTAAFFPALLQFGLLIMGYEPGGAFGMDSEDFGVLITGYMPLTALICALLLSIVYMRDRLYITILLSAAWVAYSVLFLLAFTHIYRALFYERLA